MIARDPFTARKRQMRAAGAIRAAGPGLPACTVAARTWPGAGGLARRPRVSGPGRPARYEILVDGVLDDRWTDWFGGLQVKSEGTQTVIFGPLPDQPALHRLLANVRDLGLCPDLCTRCGDGAYSESDHACGQDGLVGKTGANICYALRLANGTWD
jgi:hypothetical protein